MTDLEDGDSESKFHDVINLLDGWSADSEDRGVEVSRGLRETLDRGLNADASSRWDRDIVERRRGALAADVTVNGGIAIVVLGSARMAAVSSIRSRLSLLGGRHNYLVIYWRDTAIADGDARRLIERRATAQSLGVKGVSFVGADAPETDDTADDGRFSSLKLVSRSVVVGISFVPILFLSMTGLAHGADIVGRFPPLARAFVLGSGLLFVFTLGLAVLLIQ